MSLTETLERQHAEALAQGQHPIAWNLTVWAAAKLNQEGGMARGYFMGLPVYLGLDGYPDLICGADLRWNTVQ